MKRRSRPAIALVALLMAGWIVVGTTPTGPALAADPLADAQAKQQSLQRTLSQQRAELAQLVAESQQLSQQLDVAVAAVAQVSAEYARVSGLVVQVQQQISKITAQLVRLRAQIADLDAQLAALAAEIKTQTMELLARETLLQDHLRTAYEQSQTSLLEVILSADSLDAASNQVGYLLTLSDQDTALAAQIRVLRAELQTKQATLTDGRTALAAARDAATSQAALLAKRQAELTQVQARLATLQAAYEQRKADQEAALNASLTAKGNVAAQIAANERAAAAMNQLVARLQAEAAARQRAVEEAKRRAAADAARRGQLSPRGFRWPLDSFIVTQEWGPTDFALEPPYTYNGVYYPHFHGGIDLAAAGCGTPILAVGAGVVVASGQPLWPWDSGSGVVIDHGGGIISWYWHIQRQVVVSPGQQVMPGQVIGYEGSTGNSTGCHLHFAINDNGVWTNPRWYLP